MYVLTKINFKIQSVETELVNTIEDISKYLELQGVQVDYSTIFYIAEKKEYIKIGTEIVILINTLSDSSIDNIIKYVEFLKEEKDSVIEENNNFNETSDLF